MKKIDDIKQKAQEIDEKVKKTVEHAKNGVQRAVKWTAEHPQEAAALATAVAGLVKGGISIYTKNQTKINLKKEQELKELYTYDRHIGTHLKRNRPMTTDEVVEFERRKAGGELPALILRDMKLI